MSLTTKTLEALPFGKWASDGDNLRAKGGTKTASFYFRYKKPDGKNDDLPLGAFCPKGNRGLSLSEARDKAAVLRRRYNDGCTDLRAALKEESLTEAAARAQAEKDRQTAERLARASLQALLEEYVALLTTSGAKSAKQVAGAIKRHITDGHPQLAAKPANLVQTMELADVLRKIIQAGKLNEARKLRIYLCAAYKAGVESLQDPASSPGLVALGITHNPARDLRTVKGANRTKDRALSVAELRAYWRHICADQSISAAALRFHLLTGGQRLDQLARATLEDFDTEDNTLLLVDLKGNTVRRHTIPLTPLALRAMRDMCPAREGTYIFSVTNGRSGISTGLMSKKIKPYVAAMEAAGELESGPFTPADIRRTVETRLAALGVGEETRGRLQSHGISGVQDRHYNKYDYLAEKLDSLKRLEGLIVTPHNIRVTGTLSPA